MLTKEQIQEIREHLENAKNPVFFFDNDPDGLCSFLILQRFIGRGKGVAIKSAGSINKSYFRRVEEFGADYIFVLDKPFIDQDFIELAEKKNLTIVHIDHHPNNGPYLKYYYNPRLSSNTHEPVSDICYRITGRKEDVWIAVTGCVSDCFLPDFMEEFKKKYPELINYKYKTAFDVLYNTEIGKIAIIMSFGLRDTTSNVVSMMRFMLNASNPSTLLEENHKTKSFLTRFETIYEKYSKLLGKAEELRKENILFFSYSGDVGLNRDLANELMYKYPEKIIAIAFINGNRANISLRWEKGNIRTPAMNAVKGIEGATGDGHEHSLGVQMTSDKLAVFKKNLFEEIKKEKS